MKICKNIAEYVSLKKEGTIGFIPTMGSLHKGHLSLIKRARQECDTVIVSIYINPTQFEPHEDYDTYPKNIENDITLLKYEFVDIAFIPDQLEQKSITFPLLPHLTKNLCAKSRPNHFQGVCNVVYSLFEIIKPNKAYFGLKDYQQFRIIKTMTKTLNLPIEIIPCKTIRQQDSLAYSSRNTYLDEKQRQQAPILYKSLLDAKNLINLGESSPHSITKIIKNTILLTSSQIDYIEIVNKNTLEIEKKITEDSIIALAVNFGKTRLIDNIIPIE